VNFVPKYSALNDGIVPNPPPEQRRITETAARASVRLCMSGRRNSTAACTPSIAANEIGFALQERTTHFSSADPAQSRALWPNLFGAAVIGAPVADSAIVGHGDGSIGAGMGSEFGDWNDPAQRRVMETWDPYSNIRYGDAEEFPDRHTDAALKLSAKSGSGSESRTVSAASLYVPIERDLLAHESNMRQSGSSSFEHRNFRVI